MLQRCGLGDCRGGYYKYLATGNERQVCNGEGHTVSNRDRDRDRISVYVLELG